MNEVFINKIRTRFARGTSIVLAVFATALAVAGLMAQSPNKQQQKADAKWPQEKDRLKVIEAFNAVLTRSAAKGEEAFRSQIIESTASAKKVVQEQLDKTYGQGAIVIPSQVFIIFYEPENPNAPSPPLKMVEPSSNQDNQHYHVFYLPQPDGKQHLYKDHLMCCYPVWPPG